MKELINIQHLLNAPKERRNEFGKYNYRSAEDILKAVKPLLNETGCILLLSDEIKEVGGRHYVEATATLINEAGDAFAVKGFAREEETKKGMDASQITGTASSYARKYALNGLFAIDDGVDADRLNTSPGYTEKGQKGGKATQGENAKVRTESGELNPSAAGGSSPKTGAQSEVSLAEAIAEMYATTSYNEVVACWNRYPQFRKIEEFKMACTEQGVKNPKQ